MSKIDVSQWGEFRVNDLFEKISTKKVPFKALDLPQTPNSIQDLPLVAAGVDNQGRNRYVDPSCATILSNCLTVSANGANSGAVFYQDSDFSILQDAYALQLVDMYKKHRVQNIYLFLASVLTNVLVNNDWINKATWRTVQNKEIYLPSAPDGKPDWEYMDNYIAELAARAHKDVSSLNRVEPKQHQININNWKEFKIGDLFDYERGKEGAPKQVPDGDIPLISETNDDNGFARTVQSVHVFPANTITVSVNYAQTVFVQARPYCASVNIIVLLPTWKLVTHNSLLFLAAVISSYNSRYDYQDKVSKARLLNSKIKLPVTSSGQPDFAYMTKYVEMMQASAKCRLQSYESVGK